MLDEGTEEDILEKDSEDEWFDSDEDRRDSESETGLSHCLNVRKN
jgi:hypothetical protein